MNEKMLDEDFNYFLRNFGGVGSSISMPAEAYQRCDALLPKQIIKYWEVVGECRFGEGLFWMVDPNLYQDILSEWVKDSPIGQIADLCVIARCAFGCLYVWKKGKGFVLKINPLSNIVFLFDEIEGPDLSELEEDEEMRFFWGGLQPKQVDMKDFGGNLLFDRALKKNGLLKSDEMYGYAHRPFLGGGEEINNLEIFKIDVYHDVSQQMGERHFVRI